MPNKNNNRMGRIDEEYRKELSNIISYKLKNPNITGMISVTKVKVTNDLKYAKVYISILNGSRNTEPYNKPLLPYTLDIIGNPIKPMFENTNNILYTPFSLLSGLKKGIIISANIIKNKNMPNANIIKNNISFFSI